MCKRVHKGCSIWLRSLQWNMVLAARQWSCPYRASINLRGGSQSFHPSRLVAYLAWLKSPAYFQNDFFLEQDRWWYHVHQIWKHACFTVFNHIFDLISTMVKPEFSMFLLPSTTSTTTQHRLVTRTLMPSRSSSRRHGHAPRVFTWRVMSWPHWCIETVDIVSTCAHVCKYKPLCVDEKHCFESSNQFIKSSECLDHSVIFASPVMVLMKYDEMLLTWIGYPSLDPWSIAMMLEVNISISHGGRILHLEPEPELDANNASAAQWNQPGFTMTINHWWQYNWLLTIIKQPNYCTTPLTTKSLSI